MTLQDRMNSMKPYFRGLDVYNDAIIVKVAYPDTWKSYPSPDGKVSVTPSEYDDGITYYYADSNNTSYEEIFDLVEATIKENNEVLLKLGLLKEKVSELKEIFATKPYDELVRIQFSFPKKGKSSPTRTKKKGSEMVVEKQDTVNDKTVSDGNQDNEIENEITSYDE